MHNPKLQHMMRKLIGAPSVSSVSPDWDTSNAQVIDLLAEWCETAGFRVERLPIAGHPGKFNLVASAGQGPDGLVLSGHTDTVPYDDARWSSDPFALCEKDDRWYGLGTCDMKGFFAVVLDAIRDLDLSRLRQPLILIATADEESSMCGAKALLDTHRRLGRHAVIGEPTGLKPIRLHKGIGMEAIRLTGRSGHSSDPALGVNALEGMHQAIAELLTAGHHVAAQIIRAPARFHVERLDRKITALNGRRVRLRGRRGAGWYENPWCVPAAPAPISPAPRTRPVDR